MSYALAEHRRPRSRRRAWWPALGAAVVLALGGLSVGPAAADPASPGAQDLPPGRAAVVFTRHEGGYHTFRIPAIVQAVDGTLLAFAEGRVNSPEDNGNVDVVLKRSTDGGATWGPIQVIADAGDNKDGNPVPVVDRSTGRIVLNLTRTVYGPSGERTYSSWVMHSDDSGADWSTPTDITTQIATDRWCGTGKAGRKKGTFVNGPGKGIQLTGGPHAGRLIIAGRHSEAPVGGTCADGRVNHNHAIYSDDGGTTWHLGAVDRPGAFVPNENAVVELADGTLYFSSRDQGQSTSHRLDTTSSDGGETFDAPYTPVHGVTTSRIEGSLVRLPATRHEPDRVVLSVPNHPTAREHLTLWSSFDSGRTWKPSYEVYDGPSGYSDTVVLHRGRTREIGVLFEAGDRLYPEDGTRLSYSHDIRFTRVPEHRLDQPAQPPLTVTPDTAREQDAVISGTPDITPGRFGKGMTLAGDYVVLPKGRTIMMGDGPFTAALWFRSDYRINNLALFYGFGQYGYQPRWWVRVEPGSDRIHAHLTTDVDERDVVAPGSYADGQWHHVALTRGADGITLYVDGVMKGRAAPITGAISNSDSPVGIRVGARLDGDNYQLVGSIDEVWVFDSALSASQIAQLATTNTVGGARPVAHLPLDRITR